MSEPDYIVFDLDGTLININSIIQLQGGDWEEFHAASVKCPPNLPMVEFCRRCQGIAEIIVISGKPEKYRKAVQDWLALQGIIPEFLMMRPNLNTDGDDVLKPAMMEKLLGHHWQQRVLFAVDDRDKAVNAWRAAGVCCLQCAESLY